MVSHPISFDLVSGSVANIFENRVNGVDDRFKSILGGRYT
jgi:hypothetical protein